MKMRIPNVEQIDLLRGGSVVSSFAGAFGSALRETRLTALLVLDCKNKRYSRQAIWAAGAARARGIPVAGCDERATKPGAQRANGYIAYFCNQALAYIDGNSILFLNWRVYGHVT